MTSPRISREQIRDAAACPVCLAPRGEPCRNADGEVKTDRVPVYSGGRKVRGQVIVAETNHHERMERAQFFLTAGSAPFDEAVMAEGRLPGRRGATRQRRKLNRLQTGEIEPRSADAERQREDGTAATNPRRPLRPRRVQ